MAKMIGMSRNLKLNWLNKAAELASNGLKEQEIKEQLNEYLSFEITSQTNTRKTREILMNIWVYDNEAKARLRDEALSILRDMPEYALEIHWCMMLATYPVFADMCKLMGRMWEFQDEISLKQIKQKLYDEWGERSTLYHSIDKLIATLKAINAICSEHPGKYKMVRHEVRSSRVSAFMVFTMMMVENRGYYSYAELNDSVFFYPFQYQVEKELLLEDSRFSINHFGSELSVSING